MNLLVELIGLAASVATAFGVVMAWWQIREARRQAVTSFEDSMSREYRDIAQKLPVAALLGDPLREEELTGNLDDFYHYIDLTNEQVFLRQRGRVRADTWINWRDGIQTPDSFEELRRLEAEHFGSDPRDWQES
jgi:hypothetical protein